MAIVTLGHLPDSLDYSIEAEILRDLGAKSIRLSRHNWAYLATKTSKLGHWPDAFD